MEKYAWRAKINPGMIPEYEKRHAEIWPEMVAVLKEAGICNYTIWRDGYDLFGYYECEKGVDFACDYQANSPVVARWNESMVPVMTMAEDPETSAQPKLIKVFELE